MKLKKTLKWSGITLALIIIALAITPYVFKDKIQSMIAKTINENVNATVTFDNVGLSLFSNFPKASLTIHKLVIENNAPFKGDTLFYGEKIHLKMSIGEIFKDAPEALNIEHISAINSSLTIRMNQNGLGNFDIAKKTKSTTTNETKNETENTSFSLSIQEYNIENLQLSFIDDTSNIKLQLEELYHSGKGDFTSGIVDLDTKTKAIVSVAMDGINYMKNISLSLDAIIGVNLKNNTYSFKDNKAFINQLPLELNGSVQLVEKGQLFDLKFNTPTSSFKNMLALVPEYYSGNLNKVKTSGDFNLNGTINGMLSKKTIPKFDINIASSNAMFKYDELPKAVKNIHINTKIFNATGNSNDTKININKLAFTIDKDVFETNGKIYNLSKNPTVQLSAKGTIDLGNISKVYPIDLEKNITGILNADISTSFDMKSVEKGNYQQIKNNGNLSLKGFTYTGAELANTFTVDKTAVTFSPNQIKLTAFDAKTGDSDMHVTGNLDNFYGFLFNKQELKGTFALNAQFLKVSDFMTSTTNDTETTDTDTDPNEISSSIKIPAFLNCSITATAKKVMYDNLTLSNVSGALFIKNETIQLKDLKMGLFGGNIDMNGTVSTKEETPVFKMDLGLKGVNISDSFTQIEMLSSIAPIANTIKGKLNSTIQLSGNLTQNMTPDTSTISGDVLGQLIDGKVNTKNSKLLSSLSSKIKFLDLSKLNLNDVKAFLSFKDGKVNVKPFNLKYEDINVQISGAHSFDQQMKYNLKFDVPTKYLGSEVSSYISKLSPKDAEKIKTVPITASLSGNFTSPTISTDLQQATSNLVTQLVQQQKNAFINKGKSTLMNLLKGNKKTKDSAKTEDKVTNILKGLFGKKKN
jgi:hypothetical protein